MKTRFLGSSDLEITPIGFGAWAAGGPWKFGWGQQDDADSVAAIHQALELGVNWIDTAAIYGFGHSEEVVARALADWKGERPHVFTKCGMIWDEQGNVDYSLEPESIRRECENSLRRLRVDIIDLYQIHWPDDVLEKTGEGWAELAKLQDEGKIRWAGVSNFSVDELSDARRIAPIVSLQPPYSLVKREIEADVLPWCGRNGVGVIVYSPMASGLLTGRITPERMSGLPDDDWRKKNPEFNEPKLSRHLETVGRLRAVGTDRGVSPGEVAIAWCLRDPAVTGAIVGGRNAEQVRGVMRAVDLVLSPDEIQKIEG